MTVGRALASLSLGAYEALGSVAYPLLALIHRRRAMLGKEDPQRRGERFGHASQPRPQSALVWVHAASVGETNAVMPVIAALAERGISVLLTSGTITSAKVAAERLPAGAIHQYVPYDAPPGVSRFLDHWRPDLALVVESEIWPATFRALKRRKVPIVIVNGRMSPKSMAGWLRWPAIGKALCGAIDLCLARTEEDARNYAAVGAKAVRVAGDLKFDSPVPEADPKVLAEFKALIGERPVWLAASTHPGEEEVVAEVHRRLVHDHPGLLTLVAPRHPNRGSEVRAALHGRGLRVSGRSKGEHLSVDTDAYLIDTIGELGLFFRLAPVVFMGASLVPLGGHNPLEPAQCGAAILTGPSFPNQQLVYDRLIAARGAIVVSGADDFAATLHGLLSDPAERRRIAAAAKAVADEGRGAVERTVEAILPYLQPLADGLQSASPAVGGGGE